MRDGVVRIMLVESFGGVSPWLKRVVRKIEMGLNFYSMLNSYKEY